MGHIGKVFGKECNNNTEGLDTAEIERYSVRGKFGVWQATHPIARHCFLVNFDNARL